MKIREKSLVVFILACACTTTLSVQTLGQAVEFYFRSAEKNYLAARAKSAMAILDADLMRLDTLVVSYAAWGDMYKAVDKAIAKLNGTLSDDLTVANPFDFFNTALTPFDTANTMRTGSLLLDLKGRVLFSGELAGDKQQLVSVEESKQKQLVGLLQDANNQNFSGMLHFKNGNFAAVSAMPVTDDTGTAEPMGILVFYREYLSSDYEEFSKKIGFDFHVQKELLSSHFNSSLSLYGFDLAFLTQKSNVRNSLDAPLELLSFTMPIAYRRFRESVQFRSGQEITLWMRPLLNQEKESVLLIAKLFGVLLSFLLTAMIYLITAKWLIRPAEKLYKEIERLSQSTEATHRVKGIKGNDEIAMIGRAINQLIETIEAQENTLRQKERLALLGTLQAEFAHEVANPLGVISASLRRLKESLDEPDSEQEIRRHVGRMEKVSNFLLKLLHSFRSASRGSGASGSRIEEEEFELGDLLGTAEVIGNVKAKQHKVALTIGQHDATLRLKTDRTKFLQVINNLISNAIDAAAGSELKSVGVHIETRDKILIIRVVDSGSGLAPQMKERLFQKFATSKGSAAGTGLGLALSGEIMKSLGGECSVPPKRTQFQVGKSHLSDPVEGFLIPATRPT